MTNIIVPIILAIIIVLFAVFILGFRVFLTKKGEFPNIHIGGSKPLAEQGISCATTQDNDAQKDKQRIDVTKLLNEFDNQ